MLNFQIHLKLKQVIKIEECHERSIMACLKLLLNEKLGLSALYPNNSRQNEKLHPDGQYTDHLSMGRAF
jgi:hypothetical protein